nr:DMT family transporter [Thiorhodococcus minor]
MSSQPKRRWTVSAPAAFIGVVLIWATTPLAIKWSSESAGFLFGVTSRMVLGVFICLALVALMSRRVRWHRKALHTYLAAGLGIWGAMSCVYWASQFIPSGLISVLFGLTPIVTALLAALWLGERALTPGRLLGIALGIGGLALIFGQSLALGGSALLGVGGVCASVLIHAASAVWVKRIRARLHPLETTTGALLIAVPLFLLSWALLDAEIPSGITPRSAWSILYLACFGSALGFILYYDVLHRVEASRVALITLITPVLALFLGQIAND